MTKPQRSILTRFLTWSAQMAGKPSSFLLALIILSVWVILGFLWGFSSEWLLAINTLATINASLMVFIIQNTQYRESKALHLKIDELLRVNKETERELIAIEEREEEFEQMRRKIHKKS